MCKLQNHHGQNRKSSWSEQNWHDQNRIVVVKENCHGQTELSWSNRIAMVKQNCHGQTELSRSNRIVMVKQNWHGELIAGLEALSSRPEREASSDHNVARAQ